MTDKQKQNNRKKKKMIIITAFFIILLLIFAILIGVFLYFQKSKNELSSKNENILYYSEHEQREENNVLIVEISEQNKTNESNKNENEENNENLDNQNNVKKVVDSKYYIKINNESNVVTIYKKDSKGEYKTPVKAFICSIGDATPESGVYSMSDKYTWRLLQGNVYGQYACRITGHILFHSVPYTSQDKSTLEWWEYDKLGTKASLGCIRLKVEDAKWIYDNCASGTKVEFYSSSNPGPLGKPTAPKISNDEEVRSWDPTDPDSSNPWRTYLERKKEEEKETQTKPKQEENNDSKIENNVKELTNTTNVQDNRVTENKIQDTVTNPDNEINNNNATVENNIITNKI